jgi:hypothetical protein
VFAEPDRIEELERRRGVLARAHASALSASSNSFPGDEGVVGVKTMWRTSERFAVKIAEADSRAARCNVVMTQAIPTKSD